MVQTKHYLHTTLAIENLGCLGYNICDYITRDENDSRDVNCFDRKRKAPVTDEPSDTKKTKSGNAGAGRPAGKEADAAAKAKELLLNKLMGSKGQRLS